MGDWSGVKIEIVDEAQVRAKKNYTRVFVPMNAEVLDVLQQPWPLVSALLRTGIVEQGDPAEEQPQPRRPQGGSHLSQGVRVREFESSDQESLFDYNLNDLTIDESRKAVRLGREAPLRQGTGERRQGNPGDAVRPAACTATRAMGIRLRHLLAYSLAPRQCRGRASRNARTGRMPFPRSPAKMPS